MKTVILGKDGQVGLELSRALGIGEVIALGRSELDLTDLAAIDATLRSLQPNLIINAAAYTAVDRAETDNITADLVNHQAPACMARCVNKYGGWLIHYSTDYVFTGDASEPYSEDSQTGPNSVYGATKLAGELAIQHATENYLIFRTSWVYSKHGNSFLNTVYRLAEEKGKLNIVDDQVGSPTSAKAIADATATVAERLLLSKTEVTNLAGVYHMTCGGSTNWYQFACAILARSKWKHVAVEPIPTSAYPTPASRPHYSVLNNQKLHDVFAVRLPHWEQALAQCLEG